MWYAVEIQDFMYHQCTERFSDSIKEFLTKYQFFKKLSEISHTHENFNILSIIGTF